jgi:hypothetical protein
MKTFKLILVVMLVLGVGLSLYGLIENKGDFTLIYQAFSRDDDYVAVEKSGTEVITKVQIKGSTHTIEFIKREDDKFKVNYYESDYDYFNYSLVDGTLLLEFVYHHQIFLWGYKSEEKSMITVELPNNFAGEITASTSTGDVAINQFMQLSLLKFSTSTGSIVIDDCVVAGKMTATTSTGAVLIRDVTCAETKANSSTGKVTIDTVTSPKIDASTSTGSVDLKHVTSDDIHTSTSTGSIKLIVVGNENDYRVDVAVSTGEITFQGFKIANQILNESGLKSIYSRTSTGDITISFE